MVIGHKVSQRRGELTDRGVVVEDTAQGPRWSLAG